MIEQLTEEQAEHLSVYREKWLQIGLSTGPCDRDAVEAAVDESYRCGGYAPAPRKIWTGSPLAGMQEAYRQRQNQREVGRQVRDPFWEQIRAQVAVHVEVQVQAKIWAQVGDQVWAQVRDQVRAQVQDLYYTCGHGTQDAHWLGYYQYLGEQLGLAQEIAPLQGLIQLAEAGGGWWWPFADVVILSERPTAIHFDAEGRLHNEDGPAVLYPDGFAVYAKHGERYCID